MQQLSQIFSIFRIFWKFSANCFLKNNGHFFEGFHQQKFWLESDCSLENWGKLVPNVILIDAF